MNTERFIGFESAYILDLENKANQLSTLNKKQTKNKRERENEKRKREKKKRVMIAKMQTYKRF